MNILKITNNAKTIHIMHEAGSAGKKSMMMKINRFLMKDLLAKNMQLQKEVNAHIAAGDKEIFEESIKDMLCNISFNNHKIDKIDKIATIEKYNTLPNVTVEMITVE